MRVATWRATRRWTTSTSPARSGHTTRSSGDPPAPRRAAELDPLSLVVHQTVARSLYYAGRHEEAIDQCRRLLDMDPEYVTAYETIVRPLSALERYAEAEEFAREGVARSGRWSLLLGALGWVYGRAGKEAEARAILKELEEQARRRYVPRFHIALVHYGLRDEEAALREIEHSIARRSGVVSWLLIDPYTEWLKRNPRFQVLIRKLGLEGRA
jgi:tetratricopeptide (TPR) repeat protein